MTRPTEALLDALLETIETLDAGASYQWGHMGQCNCGHLVHALTRIPQAEIHAAALQRAGDWGQQAIDYCPTSGYPLDHIIKTMLDAGLTTDDIDYLEGLSDPRVLSRLPLEDRWLKRNQREDAITYMKTWYALLLEEYNAQLAKLNSLKLPSKEETNDQRQVA